MIDQLEMQCRMALLETRRQFTDARLRAARWLPADEPHNRADDQQHDKNRHQVHVGDSTR